MLYIYLDVWLSRLDHGKYRSLPTASQFKIFVQPIETVAYPKNRKSYVTKEYSHIDQEGRKKTLVRGAGDPL